MPILYQQTTDGEIHEQVRIKHKPFIQQLQTLGFVEYSFFWRDGTGIRVYPTWLPGFSRRHDRFIQGGRQGRTQS